MSHDSDTPTPLQNVRIRGGLSLEERLERIETMCEQILEKENATITEVALIKSKLALHDLILMGVCGVVGITVVGAILVKVVHQ